MKSGNEDGHASNEASVGIRSADPDSSSPDLTSAVAGEILKDIGIAAYVWDIPEDRLRWSANAASLLGLRAVDDISTGHRFARFIDPSGPAGRYDTVFRGDEQDQGRGVAYTTEYRFQPPGKSVDEALWIEDCGRWHAGEDGQPSHVTGIVRVVSDRHVQEAQLLYRSDHDMLTGGLNRTRLAEELATAIARADAENGACALVIIAIDHLGTLNDTYGFDVGDELVAGVAARLMSQMRKGDVLGRLAGNKVGVVLNDCSDNALIVAAERFARTISDAPISTDAGTVAVTVSVGGIVLPRHGRTPAEALSRAQEALSVARGRGVASIVIYQRSAEREAQRRRNIEVSGEVISALNAGRVELALQPIVTAHGHRPILYEALCRLSTQDSSPIPPADFIRIAERLGIIRLVDHRTLDLAVSTLQDDPDLHLAVNVSTISAMDGTWFARLAAHVRRMRNLSGRLVVEITETMAISDLTRAIDFVRSLQDLGCRVAIDDFGAGHTSFRNLRELGADIVKIDGSFVENIADSPDDQAFVKTLVSLAKHIGLETVAECVSEERDAAILRAAGIDYLQGYLFGEAEIRSPAGDVTRRRA